MAPVNRNWNFTQVLSLFREALGTNESIPSIQIVRLAPSSGEVTVEWKDETEPRPDSPPRAYRINYRIRGDYAKTHALQINGGTGVVTLYGLQDGIDYEVWVETVQSSVHGGPEQSPMRLVRTGPVPGTVVNYIHPEDSIYRFSGRYIGSPSIVRLPNGTLLASHDIFSGGGNLTIVFQSADQGNTWSFLTYLYPCFWGKLFLHRTRLYMLGHEKEYGALFIGCSKDGGRNWSRPTKLIDGGNWTLGGPHKAPMPVIEYGGRIWTAIDYGSWTKGGHASMVISAPADADLLDPDQWICPPPLPYNLAWPGAVTGGDAPGLLEGNVLPSPDGGLVNLLRYNTKGASPSYGKAILLRVDPEHPAQQLTFDRVIDFHGNMTKFTVYYDESSQQYWALVNRVTGGNVDQRNILTLVCSDNLTDWRIVKDILDYEHNGWPEDSTQAAFQYADWIMDGDDMLVLARTALNDANNFHNANHATFHRIEGFRRLS